MVIVWEFVGYCNLVVIVDVICVVELFVEYII